MRKLVIAVGSVFGRLTVTGVGVTRRTKTGGSDFTSECDCLCGKKNKVVSNKMLRAGVKSCGCLRDETTAERNRLNVAHGKSRTAEYESWHAMKGRCGNVNNRKYKDYGGRGIEVCQRWRDSFEAFLSDMGLRPTTEHSLDRFPDKDGNYEPGNCRWATIEEQNRNRRNNHMVELNGQSKTMSEWCQEKGVAKSTILNRVKSGMSPQEAFTRPVRRKGKSTCASSF